jgi:pimeloyl-ACP methyl ester carboxylesterase
VSVHFFLPLPVLRQETATNLGELNSIIGDEHDIISWDPRGTRNTLTFRCWDDPGTGVLTTEWYNSSDTNPDRLWSEATIVSELCYNRLRDIGSHVGMAAVSRDMISIVDALDEDGLVRYWGISGGTTLGSTLAAMFPDRMDKIILDGVMNVNEYYRQSVESEWYTDSDDTLRGILRACAEVGEERCPLAADGKHAEDIEAVIDELFEDLKYNPLPAISELYSSGYTIQYADVMLWLFNDLYRPRGYKNITIALDALVRRDAATYVQYSSNIDLDTSVAMRTLAGTAALTANGTLIAEPFPVYGIRCGDKQPRQDSLEALQAQIGQAQSKSKWFSGFGIGQNVILCSQWKFEAKERYTGDFQGIKTRNPILFIGNSFDPVTPLASAKNMSSGFEGSVVLEHGGYGHVSFVPEGESDCTNKAIRDYLYDGKLPEPGTKCETNKQLVDLF